MNDQKVRCSDERLLELLHSDQDGDDVCDVAAHVEHCPRCQERLEALAATSRDWRLAGECLLLDDVAESKGYDRHPRSMWATMRWQRVPSGWSESMAKQLLAPPSHPEMLGRIGRYEVERVIGSGGMGVVFKAFDTELNRPVAVKVLAPYLAGSGAARKRFAREARAAAAIVHEHVVAIHNVETEGDSPFLVMHYVAGESLQQRLDREGWLELCEILRIGLQTAAGLAAAHAQGLVHRDVKPSNILLEQGIERTLLTDFGLARASDDVNVTLTGCHPGTPQYMSPEQARGEAVDARSDLFSLGSVLYAMCTGRAPFRAETTYGILRKITDSEPRPIREINPHIPEWLCGIVAKLMSKQEADRYQSAIEVAELLEECLAHVQQPATVPLPRSVASVVDNQNRRPPLVRHAIAAAFMCSLIFAGVLIVLDLNKGKLTIQSEADDVPIRILQGGDVVENLSVSKSGKTVRIAAGRYQVEVDGHIDGISVDGGTVSLKRGGVETVRIVRSADASDSGVPQNSVPLAARKLAADLRNAQLRRTRLLEMHGAAHPEVLKLDAEIKAIEEAIQRLKAVLGTVASSSVSTSDDPNLNRKSAEPGGDVTIHAADTLSVSDIDADPVWGEAVDGLQLGMSGIRQDRRFKSSDTIRFRLHVRNVGTQAVRFEYKPSKTRPWIAPYVERTNGQAVELLPQSLVRGGHRHFTETLEPNAVVSIQVPGILVLGASDTAPEDWPRIEKPEPGEYRLRGGYYVERLDANGKPIVERDAEGMLTVKSSALTSGTVTFHIDPTEASEAALRTPREISPGDGAESANGQNAKAVPATKVETAPSQSDTRLLFRPIELCLAHFEPGTDRTEHAVPGSEQKIYVAKEPFASIVDVAAVRWIDDATGKPAIEMTFRPDSAKRIGDVTQQHLSKPVALLVGGKLLSAPTIRERFGNTAVITGQFSRVEAEQISKGVETINALIGQSVSDIDAVPVWGEAVDGLQLGVSGIRQDRHFKSGDTIRFRLSVRNVATEAIRFEYHQPTHFWWTAPFIEKANWERVIIHQLRVRSRVDQKRFTETLEPNAVASIPVSGILVLGASDAAQKAWPRIEKPEPGEYRLRGAHGLQRIDAQGKPIGKNAILSSGTVTFHIDPTGTSEAALRTPRDISPCDGAASANGQNAKAAPATKVETAPSQSDTRLLFRPIELCLAHFEPGTDRTEHAVPGSEQKIYVAKEPFASIVDVVAVRLTDDAAGKPGIEITIRPDSAKRIGDVTQQHLNKPVALLVGGKLLSAPTVRERFGNTAVIPGHFSSDEAEQISKSFETINALIGQSVSDIDAVQVWGEVIDGLQLGVSGIRQDRHFKSGDTIRFRLSVRNISTEAIRFEYHQPTHFWWIAPLVEKANGERVIIHPLKVIVRYVIPTKRVTETLEPNGVVTIQAYGILVLGASDTAHKEWPRIEKPEVGDYRLRGAHGLQRIDAQGKPIGKSAILSSGAVTFHIDQDS